ncbi:hypothetical protein [Nocardioides sp. L-11A]|uniref:hypothetical protein n=1 Tax=Nocardioides sp. L-11A TaxID=3043848 RepID=UPI00249BB3F0|nr:hypothetical protein QJ852_02235 [Nocardioides sp. L-11A]
MSPDTAKPYFPDAATVRAVALKAELRNPNPSARDWLLEKIDRPPADWDERSFLTIPGVVWTASSDTCATGRLSAPDNVAHDNYYREFVFRQLGDAAQLGAVMSAESEEVFPCYRFDGLDRWTSRSVDAWHEDSHVAVGYARDVLAKTTDDPELQECLGAYVSYLASDEFRQYIGALCSHLDESGRSGVATIRRDRTGRRWWRGQ